MSVAEIKSAITKLPSRQRHALARWIQHTNPARPPHGEHSRVRLCVPIPSERLRVGALGTVIHVYADGDAYEVEFTRKSGGPAVVTLNAASVAAIHAP